jgi:carbon storage regulator
MEDQDMLVLTRKLGQRIVIDDRISVTVLKVHGHQIQLGIEAPQSVAIKRQELVASAPAPATPVPLGRFTDPDI